MSNHSQKYLLVASTDPYSGKTAAIMGLISQLKQRGLDVAYGKPFGTLQRSKTTPTLEDDSQFLQNTCSLREDKLIHPLVFAEDNSILRRIKGEDTLNYLDKLEEQLEKVTADLVLLEGPGTLWEGSLFNLSMVAVGKRLNASILLVIPHYSPCLLDRLLIVKDFMGDRLLGVVINQIPQQKWDHYHKEIKPFLESKNIAVLGMLPQDRLLRSLSVREIARRLEAKVLCREDRLDLMVESLTIGAMNVNSALEYFRQKENMVVVTGGDRTDLQLAALETSTQCLILTGRVAPQALILSRAEDLEIPILAVDYDTLTTVEIIENALGKVRLKESIKVEQVKEIMAQYFDLERLILLLNS